MASKRLEKRCDWPRDNALMINYHDNEWGVPCVNDHKLFEYVVLDTFQAGLSWQIILNKRENFRKAFDNFNAKKIANYRDNKIKELLQDAGIIRNRLKIRGTITNAQKFLATQKEFETFSNYLWGFVKNKTVIHKHQKTSEIGSTSEESDALAKDMKRRGFKFCGSTVCYAFMQGAGLINDHLVSCPRYRICKNLARKNEPEVRH